MSVFTQLSGTLVNVVAVLIGTGLGLTVGGRLPQKTQRTLLQTLSLVTLFIALDMAGSLNKVQGGSIPGVLLALLSLAVGVVIGEAVGIEEFLERLARTCAGVSGAGDALRKGSWRPACCSASAP